MSVVEPEEDKSYLDSRADEFGRIVIHRTRPGKLIEGGVFWLTGDGKEEMEVYIYLKNYVMI
ncbi:MULTISPECIES: hypothetical protein [Thermoactinomyces]|uniref:Uncharacterized protein n=1 Tax=Thermoactinomyces daqus TaxID=1329516 RepID=A0A7W1XBD2_9BACL|nr:MULTISPECIES: hypothetical protein [Thermoactinomyces]MBA4543531.1 hypothetical protein [Thermoactinomyces daqus]MBH8599134.1 hypothetical protein [Thermoactinomyces sp. CICC 10523]MBH8605649.1 hypothetical protein [Thermoactinomyces sp. CICC 10522]MBH8607934.1 hypothetical protein [Thermoactinomyces sp. CICC 10521]